jgi:sec-independent protein translocase protein TatA
MPNIGPMELIVVLIIALVVLGPKRLPDAGKSLGRGIREFRSALIPAAPAAEDEAAEAPRT